MAVRLCKQDGLEENPEPWLVTNEGTQVLEEHSVESGDQML